MRRCARVTRAYVVGEEESVSAYSFESSGGMAGSQGNSAGDRGFTTRPAYNAKS